MHRMHIRPRLRRDRGGNARAQAQLLRSHRRMAS